MKTAKWSIYINGEFSISTRHPESALEQLDFEFDVADTTWDSDAMRIDLTTESAE